MGFAPSKLEEDLVLAASSTVNIARSTQHRPRARLILSVLRACEVPPPQQSEVAVQGTGSWPRAPATAVA